MKQDLDNTNLKKEVWERDGLWYAKVSSDYEEEGNLADGGYFYKRSQTQKMRSFDSELKANRWADDSMSAKRLALTSG